MRNVALLSTLVASSSMAAPATVAAWDIDASHTTTGFAVRHLMVSTVRGQFNKVSGTVVIDDADLTRSRLDVTIDAASVESRDAKRDEHLRSADFLDVARYPTITFRSTRVENGSDGKLRAIGDLTIHGVTKPVTLTIEELAAPSKAPWGTTVRGATATGVINRKDFGLVWNKTLETGGIAVGDEVKLTIDTELVLRDPAKTAQK
jgi:polyisoprenoid-binding protein YceI